MSCPSHTWSHFIFTTTPFAPGVEAAPLRGGVQGEPTAARSSPNPSRQDLCSFYRLMVLSVKVLGSILSMCLNVFSFNNTLSSPTLLKTRQNQIPEVETRGPACWREYPRACCMGGLSSKGQGGQVMMKGGWWSGLPGCMELPDPARIKAEGAAFWHARH